MSTDVLYARVRYGEIVEFPVHRIHIDNRGHSINDYVLVEIEDEPFVPPFHTLVQEPIIMGNRVICKWKIIPKTLDAVLNDIWEPTTLESTDERYKETITISDVSLEYIEQVTKLVSEYVSEKLDNFARSHQYDDIKSVVSYANSAIAKFKAEADRAIYLRDMCWASVYEYLDLVTEGSLPVPRSIEDIDAILPELTWE